MWGVQSPIYVGTNIPTIYIGKRIEVDNPAVPCGRSELVWSWGASKYVPANGELIAGAWGKSSPLALVTPGVTTLVEIYGATGDVSKVIPDYMLPDGIVTEFNAYYGVSNPAGITGCILGVAISGALPTRQYEHQYPLGDYRTPVTLFAGFGKLSYNALMSRNGATFGHGDTALSSVVVGNGQNTVGSFVSGANRVYVMAKPSGVNDQFRLDGYAITSKGSL